jgi:nitrogen-specific signal transduction histidine kinase/HD-like signal output (HDOD) protein
VVSHTAVSGIGQSGFCRNIFLNAGGHRGFKERQAPYNTSSGKTYMTTVHPQIREREINHLFSAPHVVVQLLEVCQEDVFSPQALQEIVLQDSALCAKILNAAVRSCPEKVDPAAPLSTALNGLSLPIIKSLAIQSAKRLVETSFTTEQVQFMRELWFYSQIGCVTARCLAELINHPDQEEAQLAGLFLNIGMLTLFSHNPKKYINNIESSLSSKEVRGQERISFGIDHLQVADALISGWNFDSFIADAVSFLHLDIEQCQESSSLIRIARLSLEVCKIPLSSNKEVLSLEIGKNTSVLNNEILLVADKLFGFTKSDTENLFHLAEKHYSNVSSLYTEQEDCLKKIRQMQKRLTSLVFSIADQEGIRSQLADSAGMETFVGTARHLYLHNSVAKEAVFFTVDSKSSMIIGLPSNGQTRLVGQLTTSLNSGSLLAKAIQGDNIRNSFDRDSFDLSMFDRQLIRLCKGHGIVCLPLLVEGQLLGGVALGLTNKAEVETFYAPHMQLLNSTIAKALASLKTVRAEISGAESTCADVNLVPKLIHEISNPLAIINNYVGVIGTLLAGTENEEILPAIENEIRRIGEISKYYTDLKDTPQLPESAVALHQLILSVVESLKPTFFEKKNIEILTDFDTTIEPIKTKSLAIKQILVNLLKNAAESLDNNGKISLTTCKHTSSAGKQYIDICIKDNGPGIDKKIRDQLFAQVTSTKGAEHAGLGLNIVKGMIDDIGAKINCISSTESGTSFNILIPRIDV